MQRYLLDGGPLTSVLARRTFAASTILPWIEAGEAVTTIVVYGEVLEYLKGFPDFHRRKIDLFRLLSLIYPHGITTDIAERYADLRRLMRRPHGSGLVGDIDTLIAATALEYGLTVVTTDSDFTRVPGLQVMLIPRGTLRS